MKTSFPKEKLRILLTEGINETAVEAFTKAGYTEVDHLMHALNEDELLEVIGNYHFIGVRSRTHLTEKVLEASQLSAIGCFCIGTNQVDLDAARRLGIPVFNSPYANTRSVAELVVSNAIALMRGVPQKNMQMHRGEWQKTHVGSFEVRGKTLGVVGYGNIGSQVGVLAEALGMRVVYFDPAEKLPLGNAVAAKSLNDLLRQSEVVTIHVPKLAQTEGMIGLTQLQEMKKGAVLINAARGEVVVVEAVAQMLANGHLAGAAFDVFPQEPKTKGEEFVSPLREHENVILTPHIGGSTHEAQETIGRTVATKLASYSDTGSTMAAVNFPQVDLPPLQGKHRILHMHQNKPGMISQINDVLSEKGINVSSQYLQTFEDVGYVVTDVDPEGYDAAIQSALEAIDGTIRTRILY